jgi:DNA-binding XRE family transcriptional regulator
VLVERESRPGARRHLPPPSYQTHEARRLQRRKAVERVDIRGRAAGKVMSGEPSPRYATRPPVTARKRRGSEARRSSPPSVTFGEYLSIERRQHGFTQDKLAEVTGLHRTHVGYIEQGVRDPRLDTLVILARGFELTPAELVERWWKTV